MKIAITGHSKGIGNAIYNRVVNHCTTVGFDITNGYDIQRPDEIIEQSLDCNIFINNAYKSDWQNKIAELWYEAHKDKDHLLVNISSIAGESNTKHSNQPWMIEYSNNKQALNKLSLEINQSGSKCKSTVVLPGIVDTTFVDSKVFPEDSEVRKFYDRVEESNAIIKPDDIANSVIWVLENFNKRYFIASITVMNNVS
jgi:NADP-dependent 3-hydroxy acid dehydrogenase YdfG